MMSSLALSARCEIVVAGPVPAIHVFADRSEDVDGRHKGGHDGEKTRQIHSA